MVSILIRSSVFLWAFHLVLPTGYWLATAWSAESLPSQQERFQGMSSTFKEKKRQASAGKSAVDAEEEPDSNAAESSASYFKLHTFVVNISDPRAQNKLVTMTLEVFCELQQAEDKWLIDTHIAPIKDSIITHVSGIDRNTIQTQKQKKELQQQLTNRVAAVLKNLTGRSVISDLYITRFIIQ